MGGFLAGLAVWTDRVPFERTTVVVSGAVHGLFANPGRHSHTVEVPEVEDAATAGGVSQGPEKAHAAPAAARRPR
jgi:hypothetical protein